MEPRPYFDKQWTQFMVDSEALKTVMVLIQLHRRQHILQAVFYVTAKIKVETSQSTCDNSCIFGILRGIILPMLLNLQNS